MFMLLMEDIWFIIYTPSVKKMQFYPQSPALDWDLQGCAETLHYQSEHDLSSFAQENSIFGPATNIHGLA